MNDRNGSAGVSETEYAQRRLEMVRSQLEARGIRDPRVLGAMAKVPRHLFLPPEFSHRAYEDAPVPIGLGQTLSQPFIVAFMTEKLELRGDERVLEIGTGSGYQTAVLAELVEGVYTVEVLETLSLKARVVLDRLGYRNISFAIGDGRLGWREEAPFNAVLAAAASEEVPGSLRHQIADGGRLILPLGEEHQDLWLFRATEGSWTSRRLVPVRFVPLIHGSAPSN
ncbi:MAG TPA: protein-L-isoaspartate(D-aspartate) O-methyltransferase [Candidatus Polarisedimenticolia bacterium]|nr:protein-L-isoaspartate(D-aspartate) O-methyltransferase [Candidatus Polarisedimenticolia bacterium]